MTKKLEWVDGERIKCPFCGYETWVIDDELQRHNLPIGYAYQLCHCCKCCNYFKIVWKAIKVVKMVDEELIENEK